MTGAERIEWRSPLWSDDFAEYRDAAFLERLGLSALDTALAEFWLKRGPQWDALGLTDRGDVLLVEAKAHVGELCSPTTQASGRSRELILRRLDETACALGARPDRAPWTSNSYQLANRLAHLRFLRNAGVPAWLVLANFVGDGEMEGPATREEWRAAYQVAWHVMGLGSRHPLARYVIEVFPAVATLT